MSWQLLLIANSHNFQAVMAVKFDISMLERKWKNDSTLSTQSGYMQLTCSKTIEKHLEIYRSIQIKIKSSLITGCNFGAKCSCVNLKWRVWIFMFPTWEFQMRWFQSLVRLHPGKPWTQPPFCAPLKIAQELYFKSDLGMMATKYFLFVLLKLFLWHGMTNGTSRTKEKSPREGILATRSTFFNLFSDVLNIFPLIWVHGLGNW